MKNSKDSGWGSKMIKFTVQFWTNDLPKGTNERTAWNSGAIHIVANKTRGIKHNHVFFRNSEEFMAKFQELMDRNNENFP